MTVTANGVSGTGKFLSRTGNDWIGLYKQGDCALSPNNQDRHKCWVDWAMVPRDNSEGTIQFEASQYKVSRVPRRSLGSVSPCRVVSQSAGTYDVRYFYGEDPTMPGAKPSDSTQN